MLNSQASRRARHAQDLIQNGRKPDQHVSQKAADDTATGAVMRLRDLRQASAEPSVAIHVRRLEIGEEGRPPPHLRLKSCNRWS